MIAFCSVGVDCCLCVCCLFPNDLLNCILFNEVLNLPLLSFEVVNGVLATRNDMCMVRMNVRQVQRLSFAAVADVIVCKCVWQHIIIIILIFPDLRAQHCNYAMLLAGSDSTN